MIFLIFLLEGILRVVIYFKYTENIVSNNKQLVLNENPINKKYGNEFFKLIYPQYNKQQWHDLQKETWERGFFYEPFTQFREKPYKGTYVNVSIHKYRSNGKVQDWPPNEKSTNIFLFGGSTLFGYGVADHETIPAYFSELCDDQTNVYNMGAGFFYSTQERILFEELLKQGINIDIAIFLDGLNDLHHGSDEPAMTNRLLFALQDYNVNEYFPYNTGIMRAYRFFSKEIRNEKKSYISRPDVLNIEQVKSRMEMNHDLIRSICNDFDVQSLFVIQPIPHFQYSQDSHLYPNSQKEIRKYKSFYKLLHSNTDFIQKDSFSLADLQKSKQEPLYVDNVHYSSRFSKLIAQKIYHSTNFQKILLKVNLSRADSN